MEPLDSDSLVDELRQRAPNVSWDPSKRQRGSALRKQAERAASVNTFRRRRRRNEIFDFKVTSEREEVHLHAMESVISETGNWILSTEQHCHYDGQAFHGPPAAVPLRCNKGIWQTQGCFCSWSCARSWLERLTMSESERNRRLELLYELAARYFGLSKVHKALPLEALTIFGGYMELGEWREAAHSRTSAVLYEPPLEPLDIIVLERMQDWEVRRQRHEFYHGRNAEEREQKERARQQKLDQDLKAAAEREYLRARRPPTSKKTLFETMGIQVIK